MTYNLLICHFVDWLLVGVAVMCLVLIVVTISLLVILLCTCRHFKRSQYYNTVELGPIIIGPILMQVRFVCV